MLKTVVLGVMALAAVAIAGVLVHAAFKPDSFRIERSVAIKAPPQRIQSFVEDFNRWREWSPFDGMDPTMKRTYSGPSQGVGAVYSWVGQGKAGAGRMEIAESKPGASTQIRLDFFKPFPANNVADFIYVPQGEATRVTWAMSGPQPYLFRLMTVFVSMDRMVGKDFETGLAALKAATEK